MSQEHWTIREDDADVLYESPLGSGGYGEVHKMRNTKLKATFARKVIRPFAGIITDVDIDNEVRAIRKLCNTKHPNIVQVLEYGKVSDKSVFFFIDMELCETSLDAYLQRGATIDGVSWEVTCRDYRKFTETSYAILQHIVNGIFYIHAIGEVHRDLSPQNVLFKDGYWKIADFGLTSEATSHQLVTTTSRAGKPSYRAPEILGEKGSFNNKADIWSFGCIVFEIFSKGKKAFTNDFQVYQYAQAKKTPFNLAKQLDTVGKYYLQGLLEYNPANRPSSKELLVSKFRFDRPYVPSKHLPKKRKIDDSNFTNTELSKFIVETIEWSSANASQPQVFQSLLECASGEKVGEVVFRKVWMDGRVRMRPQLKLDMERQNEILEAAINASDILTVTILFQTVPHSDAMDAARVDQRHRLWTRHETFLVRFPLQPQEYDYVNSEAISRLAFTSKWEPVARRAASTYLARQSSQESAWEISSESSGAPFTISQDCHIPDIEALAIFIDGEGRVGVCMEKDGEKEIRVYDRSTGFEIPQFRTRLGSCLSSPITIWFNSDLCCASFWVEGGEDLLILRRHVDSKVERWDLSPVDNIIATRISANGWYLAAYAFGPRKVYLLSNETGEEVSEWTCDGDPDGHFIDMAFSTDGNYFALATSNKTYVLDLPTTNPVFASELHPASAVSSIAFQPGTNVLYGMSKNSIQQIWGPQDGEAGRGIQVNDDLHLQKLPDVGIQAILIEDETLAFSPDGNIIAAVGGGSVRFLPADNPNLHYKASMTNTKYHGLSPFMCTSKSEGRPT